MIAGSAAKDLDSIIKDVLRAVKIVRNMETSKMLVEEAGDTPEVHPQVLVLGCH